MMFTATTVSPVILRRERKRASKDDGPPLVPRILRARHILPRRGLLRMTFTATTVSPVILRRERKRASKDDEPPLVPRILRARHILRDGREAASSG